jgi:predicted DNA binding protein
MSLVLETAVACNDAHLVLHFWATGDDFEAFERGFDDEEAITESDRLSDEGSGPVLYRVRLTDPKVTTFPTWIQLGAVLLEASVTQAGWAMTMWFPELEALREYQDYCRSEGMAFFLENITKEQPPQLHRDTGITDRQREVLKFAFQNGFFKIPREISTKEIAEQFDITKQSTSELIRRGLDNYLRTSQSVWMEPSTRSFKQPDSAADE